MLTRYNCGNCFILAVPALLFENEHAERHIPRFLIDIQVWVVINWDGIGIPYLLKIIIEI